jgi:photosynthetic reaction center cytochrome c subunit
MKTNFMDRLGIRWMVLGLIGLSLAACERPPMESQQLGFRGTGMVEIGLTLAAAKRCSRPIKRRRLCLQCPVTDLKASAVYENAEVLGDLGVGEFTRLMAAMTEWDRLSRCCNHRSTLTGDSEVRRPSTPNWWHGAGASK